MESDLTAAFGTRAQSPKFRKRLGDFMKKWAKGREMEFADDVLWMFLGLCNEKGKRCRWRPAHHSPKGREDAQ
jgi:hypothetical protein